MNKRRSSSEYKILILCSTSTYKNRELRKPKKHIEIEESREFHESDLYIHISFQLKENEIERASEREITILVCGDQINLKERKKERASASSSFLLRDSDNANFFWEGYDLAGTTSALWAQCQAFSYIYHIIGPDPNTI